MDGVPTKSALLDFWGDALPCMPAAAWAKLRSAGVIHVGGKTTHALPTSFVAGLRLGVVSYAGAGAGKYNGNAFHYYDDLPDCLAVYKDARTGGGCDPWRGVGPAPRGHGWWPVLAIDLTHDLPPRVEVGPVVAVGTKKILVICWYQLLGHHYVARWLVVEVDA